MEVQPARGVLNRNAGPVVTALYDEVTAPVYYQSYSLFTRAVRLRGVRLQLMLRLGLCR